MPHRLRHLEGIIKDCTAAQARCRNTYIRTEYSGAATQSASWLTRRSEKIMLYMSLWALSGHLIFSLSPELICHTYFDAVSNRRLETPNQIDLAINRLSNLKRMTCRKVGEDGAGDDQRGTWSDIRQFCNLGWRMMRDLGLRTAWRARTLLVKAYCLVQAGSSPSVPQ